MAKKILLIEDNQAVRENTSEILTLAKYVVITAKDGKEGVEKAEQELPDLIICDIMMPIMDGFGVLHMLSKNEETVGIPFIFLTARVDRISFRKGMELGAADYITKPFEDIELLNAIETRLRKNQLFEQEFSKNTEGLNSFLDEVNGLESILDISSSRDMASFRKKDDIYREGNIPKGMYFLSKGKIKIHQANDGGKELITDVVSEGDFFGYLSLLHNEKYLETATALESCEVMMIPKGDFFNLIYKNQSVSRKFIEILSNSLFQKERELLKLAYYSVRKRVAEALIMLWEKYKDKDGSYQTISISREDLANIVGTATETIIRTLGDFKEERLIDVKASSIQVLEKEKLRNLKN